MICSVSTKLYIFDQRLPFMGSFPSRSFTGQAALSARHHGRVCTPFIGQRGAFNHHAIWTRAFNQQEQIPSLASRPGECRGATGWRLGEASGDPFSVADLWSWCGQEAHLHLPRLTPITGQVQPDATHALKHACGRPPGKISKNTTCIRLRDREALEAVQLSPSGRSRL